MTTQNFSSKVGATVRTMAQIQQYRPAQGEHTGRIRCPRCGSALRFTILASGESRGHCAAAGCLRWHQ